MVNTQGINKNKEAFELYYRETIAVEERRNRIEIVARHLKKEYKDYDETKDFIDFLISIENVFATAEKEHWTVEQTFDEMVSSKIYIMMQETDIEESVFRAIYDEFVAEERSVAKIQEVSKFLIDKYADGENKFCTVCEDFIIYVRNLLISFIEILHSGEKVLNIDEAKEKIINSWIETTAMKNEKLLGILRQIYSEFKQQLKQKAT